MSFSILFFTLFQTEQLCFSCFHFNMDYIGNKLISGIQQRNDPVQMFQADFLETIRSCMNCCKMRRNMNGISGRTITMGTGMHTELTDLIN